MTLAITASEAFPMSRPSGRAPDVDPELIRQVMSRSPRPTSAAAAKWISEYLGRPVSASLIRLAIRRHPEWALGAGSSANDTTRRPVMKYECERALGPILPKDKKAHVWMMLTAYERMQAGIHAFLTVLAEHPDEARTLLVEVIAAGPEAAARRDGVLQSFAELLHGTGGFQA
jgi:hypothetical protein